MAEKPAGNVTFLFNDIEGSTERWDKHPDAMRPALERHDALMRTAVEAHAGHVFKTVGDAFCAAFATAGAGLAAAIEAQRHSERISQVVIDGLRDDARPLRTVGELEARDRIEVMEAHARTDADAGSLGRERRLEQLHPRAMGDPT